MKSKKKKKPFVEEDDRFMYPTEDTVEEAFKNLTEYTADWTRDTRHNEWGE